MSKVGVYHTSAGNIPAIVNELSNGKFDVLALGNANAQRKADPTDVSYARRERTAHELSTLA